MTHEERRALIGEFGNAPDGQLAEPLAEMCSEYAQGEGPFQDDPEMFLANLRDLAVYTGGASGFVMQVFAMAIDDPDIHQRLDDHPDSMRNDERYA